MDTVVYQWVREDRTPYYIGIGNPRRPYKGRRRCGRPPSRDRIIILHENLEWEEACRIEKELIAFYGRKDLGTGILRNLTDGGEGLPNPSKETREKISEAVSGENHPNFGKSTSKETREKISKSMSGENHPNFGKSLSKETREKLSKSLSGENHPMFGKSPSKETREKLSGENNPNFGKSLSKETRDKISKKLSKPKNWYHPDHGEVLQKSLSEMVKLFSEQNLSLGNLSEVARGVRNHHKGWTALKA